MRKKNYYSLDSNAIDKNRQEKANFTFFHLDGSIQVKENICSCEDCIQWDFISHVVYSSLNSDGDSDEEDGEIEEESVGN